MVSNPFANGLSVQIDADTSGFRSGLSRSMSKLGDFRTEVGLAGAAIGTAFAAGAGKAIQAAGDFDAAMQESLAIMGDVSDDMRAEMEDTARTIAKETQFSAEEAAESYFFLASAGLDAAEANQSLGDVAQFAQAGMFDMAEATDILTDANSALGRETEEMVGLGDQLVKANTLANASVQQFGEALTSKAAPAMERMGVESEEGIAALSTFADQGLKGRRAGTIFARTLEGLEKQARNNSEEFEELGVRVFDADGEMRDLADITADMEGALGDMSTEQKQAALEQLGFNKRAMQGVDLLMGNSEQLREYESELGDAGGTAEEVADKQMDTFNQQMGLFKDQLTDVGISIGQVLLPHLTTLMGHLSTGVDRFAALNEKTNGMAGAVALVGGAVGGFAVAIAALTPVLGAAAAGIGAIIAPLGLLAGAIGTVLAPLGAITTALGVVLAPLGSLLGLLAPLTAAVSGLLAPLAGAAGALGTVGASALAILGPIALVVAAVGALAWAFKNHGDTIKRVFTQAMDVVKNLVSEAAAWLQENGPALMKKAFKAIGQGIRIVLIDLYNAITGNEDSVIKSLIVDAATWLKNEGPGILVAAVHFLIDLIFAAFEGLYEGLIGGSLIPDMFEEIASYIAGAAKDLLVGAVDSVIDTFKTSFENWRDWLMGGAGLIKSLFSDIASYISGSAASDLASAAASAGGQMFGALKDKFNSLMPPSLDIPSVSIGGQSIGIPSKTIPGTNKTIGGGSLSVPSRSVGGQSIGLPSLDTGGFIESEGLAMLHAGEQVVPAADVANRGGGGDTINVGGINVTIEGDADRQTVKRGLNDALRAAGVPE